MCRTRERESLPHSQVEKPQRASRPRPARKNAKHFGKVFGVVAEIEVHQGRPEVRTEQNEIADEDRKEEDAFCEAG
jgi:hypothetical protein